MTSARFLGTTDEVTTCDCCGRSDLKSTVALELTEGADAVYFGVNCAARALLVNAKIVTAESRKADRAKEKQAELARAKAHAEASAPWFAFLAAFGVGADTFSRIQSLGGYKAARARFDEYQAN